MGIIPYDFIIMKSKFLFRPSARKKLYNVISYKIIRFTGHQQGPLSQLGPKPLVGQPYSKLEICGSSANKVLVYISESL